MNCVLLAPPNRELHSGKKHTVNIVTKWWDKENLPNTR